MTGFRVCAPELYTVSYSFDADRMTLRAILNALPHFCCHLGSLCHRVSFRLQLLSRFRYFSPMRPESADVMPFTEPMLHELDLCRLGFDDLLGKVVEVIVPRAINGRTGVDHGSPMMNDHVFHKHHGELIPVECRDVRQHLLIGATQNRRILDAIPIE